MLDKKLQKLVAFLKSEGASRVILFGSYASGTQRPSSDVDVIVRFKKPMSLLELVGVEQDASKLLGKKVDLLTEGAISPYMKDSIFSQSKVLL